MELCFNREVENTAYIALGSNLGDREMNLLRAVTEIARIPGTRVTGLSHFYETSPVGFKDQPPFNNAVLRISTGLSPGDLLLSLQRIEDEVFKRKRGVMNGPRTMDLDILLYNDLMLESENLVIPHPEMTRRRFVLQPLNDIAPDAVHPASRRNISAILASLESDESVTKI